MEKTNVFCVFEGGGAKGVAHVGFLKAIESQAEYNVSGYAGTSAGAIIAALAAVGWTGKELHEEKNGRHVSSALQILQEKHGKSYASLADLITKSDWRRISWAKGLLGRANAAGKLSHGDIGFQIMGKLLAVASLVLALVVFSLIVLSRNGLPAAITLIILGIFSISLIVLFAYIFGKYRGFASIDEPKQHLETLLRAKIKVHSERGVTFGDLKRTKLKIVAANLETGQLQMFSDETPDVLISDAVAASAAIPLIFKPVVIDGVAYCDGGIVSNLPAWTFDRERILDERCLVITCEIAPPRKNPPRRPELMGIRLLTRIAVTAIFGGSGLNTRGMLLHLKLESWASFSVLDFEEAEKQVALIDDTEKYAELEIEVERKHKQSIKTVFEGANTLCQTNGMSESGLRVAYARFVTLVGSQPAAFHLWNCLGFNEYHDEHIVLPVEDSLIADAVHSGQCKFFDLADVKTRERYMGNGRANFPRKRFPLDRRWVAVVPLPRRVRHSRVSVAVCFDGAGEVPLNLNTFMSKLQDIVLSSV